MDVCGKLKDVCGKLKECLKGVKSSRHENGGAIIPH